MGMVNTRSCGSHRRTCMQTQEEAAQHSCRAKVLHSDYSLWQISLYTRKSRKPWTIVRHFDQTSLRTHNSSLEGATVKLKFALKQEQKANSYSQFPNVFSKRVFQTCFLCSRKYSEWYM